MVNGLLSQISLGYGSPDSNTDLIDGGKKAIIPLTDIHVKISNEHTPHAPK